VRPVLGSAAGIVDCGNDGPGPTRHQEAHRALDGPAASRPRPERRGLSPRAAPHPAMHLPPADLGRLDGRAPLRRRVPLLRPAHPDPARRPRLGDPDLQRLHRAAHLPAGRGLIRQEPDPGWERGTLRPPPCRPRCPGIAPLPLLRAASGACGPDFGTGRVFAHRPSGMASRPERGAARPLIQRTHHRLQHCPGETSRPSANSAGSPSGAPASAVCKPSPVPRRGSRGDGHPSVAAGCPAARAADPRAGSAPLSLHRLTPAGLRPPTWPCSG